MPFRELKLPEAFRSTRYLSGLGFAAIATAATLWAIAAIVATELLQSGINPYELTVSRAVISATGLALISQLVSPPRKLLDGRILLLGISLAMVTASYYVAISRLSVAVALVIQYTAPAMVVAVQAAQNRQIPPRPTLIAVAAALLGVVLISGIISGELRLDALGLLAASLSALFFASYTLLSAAVVDTYGAIGVMFRGFLVSSLFWVTFQVSQGFPYAIFAAQNLPGILFVGICGTLVPFCLLCWGIQQVNAERGAIVATLEPVVAAILAWIWLHQTLSGMQMLGGVLVIGAVILLSRQKRPA